MIRAKDKAAKGLNAILHILALAIGAAIVYTSLCEWLVPRTN